MKAPYLLIATEAERVALYSACQAHGISCEYGDAGYVWFYHARVLRVMRSGSYDLVSFAVFATMAKNPYTPVNSIRHFVAAALAYRAYVQNKTPIA